MNRLFVSLILLLALVLASCSSKTRTDDETMFIIDIAQFVQDCDNDVFDSDDSFFLGDESDTIPVYAQPMMAYFKQEHTNLAADVEQYLDSIVQYTGIPLHNFEEELVGVLSAIHELRRFQTGERKYYPDKEVKATLNNIAFELGDVWSHGTDCGWCCCMYYWYSFATQAALLCPNLEFITSVHSLDQKIGLLSYSEWSTSPMMSCLVKQKDGFCTIQLIDVEKNYSKIFEIENETGRKYYLLASESEPGVFNSVDVCLFDNNEGDPICVAKDVFSYAYSLYEAQVFYEDEISKMTALDYSDIIKRQAERFGVDCETIMDSIKVVYTPSKRQWDVCLRNGEEYWYKIEGTPSLHLCLEAEKPFFEVVY